MNYWKSKLIDAYRFASWPYRWSMHRRMARSGEVPVLALFYHRVADDHQNAWTIGRDDFQRQIDWLQDHFEIVDLQECQRRIRSGFNKRPTVAITFDDGYADNCEFALPMLIERRIPVTYFVTTQHTLHQQAFEHDLDIQKPLPTNSIESLRALDLAGVEIGAHSRSHLDLGKVTCEKTLIDEVIASSKELESAIGRKVRYFAFPYGLHSNLNANVFAMLKEAGFLGACSAYQGWNEIGMDDFHIQRIHGDPSFSRFKNWMTFDPRVARVKRFDYSAGKFDKSKLDSSLAKPTVGIPLGEINLMPSTYQHPTVP
ncbi:MAG: polysaccharide deacetylase family protein [Mariniblastus sp.]|nr:polysaccharide deacetylase family protein [Mariniblastus sp.]